MGISGNEYQRLTARTLTEKPREYTDQEMMIVWDALGIAGEAGEIADYIKKAIFHEYGIDKDIVIKECGDVLWHLAALCTTLGIDLDEVFEANIEKLRQRYPNGFNSEDSRNRKEVEDNDLHSSPPWMTDSENPTPGDYDSYGQQTIWGDE